MGVDEMTMHVKNSRGQEEIENSARELRQEMIGQSAGTAR